MPLTRRSFVKNIFAAAPAIILTPGLLMPVKTLWTPGILYKAGPGTRISITQGNEARLLQEGMRAIVDDEYKDYVEYDKIFKSFIRPMA